MKETIKRLATLLCFVAMLSVVSMPAFGGENPWDSDGSSGSATGTGTPPPGDSGTGFQQPLYLGTVYVGIGGLLTFVSQSVDYIGSQYIFVRHGRRANDQSDSRTETTQQKDF